MEFLANYGLFLAQAVTIVVAIIVVLVTIFALGSKGKGEKGQLELIDLSEALEDTAQSFKETILPKDELKKRAKAKKKADKESQNEVKPNLYVIDFNGSMDASQVEGLRREITAIVQCAQKDDEVLVRLESPGGVVHGYGLAASQLQRITKRNIPLTIAVDKVAASGGYMMACIANKIVAAPFAIIGSIGVIAQIPNFSRVLKKNDIDFEQVTAGEYKRTLTMFGENTDQDREKFQSEIDDVHGLFKNHVAKHRLQLDINKVSTGETWYGEQALEIGLVDELSTSDDWLLSQAQDKQVYLVQYNVPKTLSQKLGKAASTSVEQGLYNVVNRLGQWKGF